MAMWPSDSSHAMMDSSARMGRRYVATRESRANTPMYITTANSAVASVHLCNSRNSASYSIGGSPANEPTTNSTSSVAARA